MTNWHPGKSYLENGKLQNLFYTFDRSDEALELHTYVKKIGIMPDYCVEDYLVNYFETLFF